MQSVRPLVNSRLLVVDLGGPELYTDFRLHEAARAPEPCVVRGPCVTTRELSPRLGAARPLGPVPAGPVHAVFLSHSHGFGGAGSNAGGAAHVDQLEGPDERQDAADAVEGHVRHRRQVETVRKAFVRDRSPTDGVCVITGLPCGLRRLFY